MIKFEFFFDCSSPWTYLAFSRIHSVIEKYKLWKFDGSKKQITKSKRSRDEKSNNDSNYIVKKGDTLYSISKKFSMPVNLIKKLNNLEGDNLSVGQTIIIKK